MSRKGYITQSCGRRTIEGCLVHCDGEGGYVGCVGGHGFEIRVNATVLEYMGSHGAVNVGCITVWFLG